MARINFNQIFKSSSEPGKFSPRSRVRVGGVTLNSGVSFGKGIAFGGIDLAQFVENDFEVDIQGDLFIIKGIYADAQTTVS
ncbi:MAG: hypothetical protein CMI52_03460 [Parcubacteria group bacterium]|nr:hypothetical protein [Parcubacteria group bacterium]